MPNVSEGATDAASAPYLLYFVVCFREPHFGILFSFSLMSLCFLVATPANAWCLWFHLRTECKSRPARVFSLNQTVIEMIFCLQCPIEILNAFVFRSKTVLRAVGFIYGTTWIGRSLLQSCICVEQYMAVVYPVMFLRLRGVHYRVCVAVVCWSIGAGYGLYLAYRNIFPDMVFIFVFFVVVSVISFCCASVLCALKGPGPGDRQAGDQRGADAGNLQKRNAFNTIFTVLLLTLFTYSPQVLLIHHELNVKTASLRCEFIPFTTSLYILGFLITPLLKMYKEGYLNLKRLKLSILINK